MSSGIEKIPHFNLVRQDATPQMVTSEQGMAALAIRAFIIPNPKPDARLFPSLAARYAVRYRPIQEIDINEHDNTPPPPQALVFEVIAEGQDIGTVHRLNQAIGDIETLANAIHGDNVLKALYPERKL